MAPSLAQRIADNEKTLPDLLFVDEVAVELRRSENAVRWLINSKQLKAGRLGGRVVVRRGDLEKFIADAFEEAS